MKFYKFCTIFLFFVALSVVGCNSGKVPVQGKVTFSDDQTPVKGTVYFQTENHLARGELKPDGSYILGSEKATDGLPPGKYYVYVLEEPFEIGKTPSGEPIYESIIESKFSDPFKSGLVFEAKKGEKQFDFQVDRRQNTKKKK